MSQRLFDFSSSLCWYFGADVVCYKSPTFLTNLKSSQAVFADMPSRLTGQGSFFSHLISLCLNKQNQQSNCCWPADFMACLERKKQRDMKSWSWHKSLVSSLVILCCAQLHLSGSFTWPFTLWVSHWWKADVAWASVSCLGNCCTILVQCTVQTSSRKDRILTFYKLLTFILFN